MLDRCWLTESRPVPSSGAQKDVVPVDHAHMAHAAMPGSQWRFSRARDISRFTDPARSSTSSSTSGAAEPAEYDQAALR